MKARRVMWWGAMEGGMCGQRGVKRWSFRGRRGRSNIFFGGPHGGNGDGWGRWRGEEWWDGYVLALRWEEGLVS